jgi:trk system potassium uptake protein TrkA
MKIVIAGGQHAADYIIKKFKTSGNKLIVINENRAVAQYLTKANRIPVFYGQPYKYFVLNEANVENADIFIALGNVDTDNYVSCLLAKRVFNVKKCICTINNPKNVELYRELGIDSVISSTQLLATSILNESSLEDLIKTMSLEDEQIVLSEVVMRPNFAIVNKRIADINFPKNGNISCIYRKPTVIIPNGSTIILPKDKLLIVTTPKHQKEILDYIQKVK